MQNPALTATTASDTASPGRRAEPVLSGAAPRISEIDVARTLALAGMVVFHFARDLEIFGHLPSGTTLNGGWPLFARLVAGSFLFLAGVSLVLGHGDGIRWRPFLRRLAAVGAAALAITAATYAAMPEAFIFYGILHSIAVASVAGLLFLRLPAPVLVAVAAFVALLPGLFRSAVFDAPWLVWTGLAERVPRSLDFEPFFPWFAPFLAGMALARLAATAGLWDALRARPLIRTGHWATWPGRHSLVFYLAHQPVLLGLLWLHARIAS